MLFGAGGKVFRGSKQVGVVQSWRIDQAGGSETDWSGSLTATWEGRPELGDATLELKDGSGANSWKGKAIITDVPFKVGSDRKVEIGFQGNGPLEPG